MTPGICIPQESYDPGPSRAASRGNQDGQGRERRSEMDTRPKDDGATMPRFRCAQRWTIIEASGRVLDPPLLFRSVKAAMRSARGNAPYGANGRRVALAYINVEMHPPANLTALGVKEPTP